MSEESKTYEELEAENRILREAMGLIKDFAYKEYWKVVPAPVGGKFRTIERCAEKALKGELEWV